MYSVRSSGVSALNTGRALPSCRVTAQGDRRASLAAPQAPPRNMEGPAPPLLRRQVVASQRRTGTVQPRLGFHHVVPIPGHGDPGAMASRRMRKQTCALTRDLRSARCLERGTPGAGRGPRKRPCRKAGRYRLRRVLPRPARRRGHRPPPGTLTGTDPRAEDRSLTR